MSRRSPMVAADTILRFIADYQSDTGMAPTLREITAAVGLTSFGGMSYRIRRMVEAGLIHHTPSLARSIRLTEEGKNAAYK